MGSVLVTSTMNTSSFMAVRSDPLQWIGDTYPSIIAHNVS